VSSPGQLADVYAQRAQRLTAALRRGMKRALLLVEKDASQRLSGSGSSTPGAYPIPVRSGNLRRGLGVRRLGDTSGLVFNRSNYARAVHSTGFHAYGNERAPFYEPRPFLSDAIEAVNPTDVVRAELAKAVLT